MIQALIGNLSLICLFITCISTLYFSFWIRQKQNLHYYLNSLLINLQFLFCSASLICLSYGYITSNFAILNVYQNSSISQPLFFKIAALWGNHEGSLLLWLFLLLLCSLIFAFTAKIAINYKSLTILIQSVINACFTGFIIFTSNPFTANKTITNDGLGFNPLLQDYMLMIHPPILYIAYSASSIIFSLTVAGFITKQPIKLIANTSYKWAIFTFCSLTTGITLGSWWAYRELGWGGYWFWDPVENSSLLPWLVSLGLIHTIKRTFINNKFDKWYQAFSLGIFCSSIIATLIVRSGIISSVHSFANDSARGIYILLFLGCLLLISITLLSSKTKSKPDTKSFSVFESGFLLLFSLVITLFLTIILTIILPLLTEIFLDYNITIGEPYFNRTFVPIAIIGLCCAAIFSIIQIRNLQKLNYKNLIFGFLSIVLILAYLKVNYHIKNATHFLYLFSSIFLINSSIMLLCAKNNYRNLAMIGSHIGIAVIAIGMTLSSSLSEEFVTKLSPGKKFIFSNYSVTLNKILLNKQENFIGISAKLYVEKNSNEIGILQPEIRFFTLENSTTTESAIFSSIFEDLYININEIIDQENITIKIQIKPFIAFIWIGAIMIVSFSLLALFRQKL